MSPSNKSADFLGFNVGLGIDYSEWGFHGSPQRLQANSMLITQIKPLSFPHNLQVTYPLITLPMQGVPQAASLNKPPKHLELNTKNKLFQLGS